MDVEAEPTWTRYGLVAVWRSVDPERNRDRVYVLHWESSIFGPALRAEWGRAGSPLRSRIWWPDEANEPAEEIEQRVIFRRRQHKYVETQGPAFPAVLQRPRPHKP
jgi:predicted DNA-binding WGR domain protein